MQMIAKTLYPSVFSFNCTTALQSVHVLYGSMKSVFSFCPGVCTDTSCAVLSEQCEDQPCPADMQCVSIEAKRGHYACQCPPGKLGECAGLWVCEEKGNTQNSHFLLNLM